MSSVAGVLCVLAATASPSVPATTPPDTARYPSEEALRSYAQARLSDEEGDAASALNDYYRTLRSDPGAAAAALHVSELAARSGSAERSLEFAERAIELRPDAARGHWLKGAALFNLGRAQDALEPLQVASRLDTTEAEYARGLARVAETLDRVPLVAEAFRRVVSIDDGDGEAYFQLAAAECRLGRFDQAAVALARAREIEPRRPGIAFLEGWIQESTGRPDDAMASYRDHLSRHPDDNVTRRRLVNLLVRSGKAAEAYPLAKEVALAHPDDLEAQEVQAELALRTGRAPEGLEILERVRAHDPEDPERVMRSVGVLVRSDRAADAVRVAKAWADARPADVRGLLLTARTRALTGDVDGAAADARRAVAMAPDSIAPHAVLGRIYQGARRWKDAAAALEESARRFPESAGFGLDLAFCREQLGDIPGAERAARAVLAHHPDHAGALNSLGYLLADHNQQLDEAHRLIARAVEKEPENGAFIDSMGWLYYRLGRLDDARRQLERAVDLTGGDPVVREHLGDVYKDLRLLDLAREQYRLARAADSDNARLQTKIDSIR
jgi:tetratricopeptide (TPR) repeat protein